MANAVAIPYPPDDVLELAGGRHRGAQAASALGDFLGRVARATTLDEPLQPGPSLQQIDREFKNHAVFICSYLLGTGLMTIAASGDDSTELLAEVHEFMEGRGGQ